MPTEIAVALIESAPVYLALLTILVLGIVYRDVVRKRILPRVGGVKVFGFEITLLKESLDHAAAASSANVSEGDKWSALQRAEHVRPVFQGAHILWVDDRHRGSQELIRVLRAFGSEVDLARSSDEAMMLLKRHQYEVVISDISRTEGADAGLKMLERMYHEGVHRWTIFYVRNLKAGVPPGAFGITNRPDHLLHLVMDALERERWGNLSAQQSA
jgi:hypothetical protein